MTSLDTSREAAEVQTAIQRRLGMQGRFRLAVEMSEAVRAFAKSGIRVRHPHLDERAVAAELRRVLYGASALAR